MFVPFQFRFGSDVSVVALIIPAGSPVDDVEPFNGTAESRPNCLLAIHVVCDHDLAYGRLGRKEEASKILSHLQEASNGEYISPNDLCLVYAALGDKNKAFASLETAYEQQDASLVWIKVAPESDALRSDPRFANFIRRMNFPVSYIEPAPGNRLLSRMTTPLVE